jgi:CHAD domain-containing protein
VPKQGEIRGLSPDDATRDAAAKIVWTLFDDMWRLRTGVLANRDSAAVHDMRVASRRLRTAMQTFQGCFSGKRATYHSRRVKKLADLLGEVRDRDVLLEELEHGINTLARRERAGVQALVEGVRRERDAQFHALVRFLKKLDRVGYDRSFLSYFGRKLE